MWLMVAFDLPTDTKEDRKRYGEFRKGLLKLGFSMLQYSIYVRWSGSLERCEVQKKKLQAILPCKGQVSILMFTDKQYGMIEHYYCSERNRIAPGSDQGHQLEIF